MAGLVARDLAVTPPGAARPVVEGFSVDVRPGELVAIGGANGSGKSSVLLALAGLWEGSAGSVTLDGAPLGPTAKAREKVAAVLQDPSSQLLAPTVREEIGLGALNLGVAPAEVSRRVDAWASRLGLGSELALDPRTLSAGRQQMVLLAAAMVVAPVLLCADEATAHLDPASRRLVAEALREERTRGLAVVWVTQDPVEASTADRVVAVGGAPGGSGGAASEAQASPRAPGQPVGLVSVSTDLPAAGAVIRVAAPLEIPLEQGRITALRGRNGAGKSALLAAVAGLAASPQVRAEWRRAPDRPPIVALQYPELQVFEETVADEITFAAVARGLERARALERAGDALERLGFEPGSFLGRRTWQLSTGEKRLVEVVAALVAPSSLVLLDEPTAGIDDRRRFALGRMLREIEDVPVLLASQDDPWLRSVSDRTVTLG